MKKLLCFIALAAICSSSVFAAPAAVISDGITAVDTVKTKTVHHKVMVKKKKSKMKDTTSKM